ncbi:MAG: IPT/TIG domain-containing protein [Planctomycetes bacterium]|nr:IPT/TIG domain-containing protein [Planctomycetota bacterium]
MRPILTWILVAVGFGVSPTVFAQPRLWTGDVDGNGSIDVADAFATLRAASGNLTLSPAEAARADVDHDGRVTVNDALALINATTMPVAHPPFDPVPPNLPEIHSFDPPNAEPGSLVFVEGVNFDPIASRNRLSWNGIEARAWLSDPRGLLVRVPVTATSGPVTVTVAGLTSLARGFVIGDEPNAEIGLDPAEGEMIFGLPRDLPHLDDVVTVPIVVNEGRSRLGSYNVSLHFTRDVLAMGGITPGNSPFDTPGQCIDNLSGTANFSALRFGTPGVEIEYPTFPAPRTGPGGPSIPSATAPLSLRHVGVMRFRAIQDADRMPTIDGIVTQMATVGYPSRAIGSLPRFALQTTQHEQGAIPQPPRSDEAPWLRRLLPNYGYPGDLVILRGTNLGQWVGRVQVFLGETPCTIVQLNPTEIWFRVPANAQSGSVAIEVRGRGRSNSLPYRILSDQTPPTVMGIAPADGTRDVDPTVRVRVLFSEAIDADSIHDRSFQVFVPWYWNLDESIRGTKQVPGSLRITHVDGATGVVFEPILPLPPGSEVLVSLRDIRDLNGNALVGRRFFAFRVAGH